MLVNISGVPAGATFNAGTNLGGGVWSFTEAQLAGLQIYPPSGFTGTLNLSVTATSTELANGDSITTPAQSLTINISETTNTIYGTNAGQTLNGTVNNDLIEGFGGNDVINGGDGNDILYGGAGNDTINGGAGNDVLIGGQGNDTLTGGLGADVFKWSLADAGVAGTPAVDIVTDFDTVPGGDKLDLRDLLQGEIAEGAGANLENYLHFEKVGTDTVVHISSNGSFGSGYNPAAEVQTITLQNVDLVGSYTNDQQIIQNLLDNQKLITD
jgi:hypothetical protein